MSREREPEYVRVTVTFKSIHKKKSEEEEAIASVQIILIT
jgi:hypothetical protein